MTLGESPLEWLRSQYAKGLYAPETAAREALSRSNRNATRNVYLEQRPEWTLAEAKGLPERFPDPKTPALYGIPISIKDCFDLAGFHTTCGSHFYAGRNAVAVEDSWVAEVLRAKGAIITGKTHLHQLAYGITGENRDYGNCVQPRNATWLTGGSSSGAAASVQEGSAIAAIGTDTGGSIRAPAALSGLAGYRSSLGTGDWRGGAHLAPSFDTIGWLFGDLTDAPLLAEALFGINSERWPETKTARIGIVGPEFLHDCAPEIRTAFESLQKALPSAEIGGLDVSFWQHSWEIFAPIQAHEAAALHRANFSEFEPSIADRLAWGASIPESKIDELRRQHVQFSQTMDDLFADLDFLLAPCCPVTALISEADNSGARQAILRYTTPASVGGNPVVAVPFGGTAFQLIGRRSYDSKLLSYAALIGEKFALTS